MIIPKIKSNFTPLIMAVIIGHFQTSNSIFLGCFNWTIMIRSDYSKVLIIHTGTYLCQFGNIAYGPKTGMYDRKFRVGGLYF